MPYETTNQLGKWILHTKKVLLKDNKEHDMFFFVKEENMPNEKGVPCDLADKYKVEFTKNGWPYLKRKDAGK